MDARDSWDGGAARELPQSGPAGAFDPPPRRPATTPEPLALWSELLAGHWKLLRRIQTDGEELVVVATSGHRRARPAPLTTSERAVAGPVARGLANAEIAYDLGLLESTVGSHVSRVLRKLWLRDRSDLIRFAARSRLVNLYAINGEWVAALPPLLVPTPTHLLSRAEQDIYQSLIDGATNAEIADRRAVSCRTVANQVSSILRKCGVASRQELLAVAVGN
ncbi:MAG: LuxR C-terminal-related transcriptional regulator [Sandaracinaceae bacterium]